MHCDRSFEKKDTSTWEVIDIANDVRGDRLVIAQDVINGISEDDIDRGNLLIMIFDENEDQGNYKCEAVYDTAFDDTDMTFEISKYEVKSNGECFHHKIIYLYNILHCVKRGNKLVLILVVVFNFNNYCILIS